MITVPASEVELLPGPWPDLPNLPDLPWFPDTALQIEKVTSAARFMAGIAEEPTSVSSFTYEALPKYQDTIFLANVLLQV